MHDAVADGGDLPGNWGASASRMFASASPCPLMCRSATSRFTSPSTTSFSREWSEPTSSTMPEQRSTGVPPATSKTPNLWMTSRR